MKKLRLHTPKGNGASKCHTLHIGKKITPCQDLQVDGYSMENVCSDSYLGDILSYNGKLDVMIEARVSKGIGLVSQIFDVLKNIPWGSFYFEAALTLRESILVNGLLFNSEVWYGLKQAHIDKIETIDNIFYRKLFKVTFSCPKEAFHLETGRIPLGIIIRCRRLKYLHHLVTRQQNLLLSQVFRAQWRTPVRNDWVEIVKDDLKYFEVNADLNWINSLSKNKFKKLVNEKARKIALIELNELKSKHTKLGNLKYDVLECQKYIKNKSLSKNQVELIFKSRCRMKLYWENYKGWKFTRRCPLCNEANKDDTQIHSFDCRVIKEHLSLEECRLSDIYSDNISSRLAKSIENIEKLREQVIGKFK